jgi:phospholipid transport system substrate-binding protein
MRVLGLGFVLAAALIAHAASAPDELVRRTAEDVLGILRQDAAVARGDLRAVSAIIDAKVLPHFDFERMTRLAAGKYWRSATASEQAAMVREFRALLVRTYAVALAEFRDRTLTYRPLDAAPTAREVVVQTEVATPSGKPIRLDYRMAQAGSAWKVYDILVDGVSLVVNYRALFDSTVNQSGIAGLIELLARKNAQAASLP